MNLMLQAFAALLGSQAQLGGARLGLQRDALFGRHLGIGGGDSTSGAGDRVDPWSAGGLFHGGFASSIPSGDLANSAGATAENQWKRPDLFGGQAWRGATPTALQGRVTNPGITAPNMFGFSTYDSASHTPGPLSLSNGSPDSFMYDPRYDRAEGLSGILSRYDPALGGGRPSSPSPSRPKTVRSATAPSVNRPKKGSQIGFY